MIARPDMNEDRSTDCRVDPAPRRLPDKPSAVEATKAASNYLRGGIKHSLDDPCATRFEEKDEALLKFHGMYQQYDRDARAESTSQSKDDRIYSLMVRCRIPAGILTAEQYLAIDALARSYGHDAMRLTARQSIQFHGVLKGDVRSLLRGLNSTLVSTLAACGDVNRNVMCCPAIDADPARRAAQQTAHDIAMAVAPRTSAYHDIWLNGERIGGDHPWLSNGHNGTQHNEGEYEVEPIYGKLYLPRKFKMGISLPGDNCIDVYTQDCGFIAIIDQRSREITSYNLVVGGGLGMTHRKQDTFARLGSLVGSFRPEHAVEAARIVIEIFRDFGDREDRRHARLKYVIEEFGTEWFIREFDKRASFALEAPRRATAEGHNDHLGWHDQGDGLWSYGVFIENGRLRDGDGLQWLSAIRDAVDRFRPGVRITPHQNLLLTNVRDDQREPLINALRDSGMKLVDDITRARRHSMACPALPTCGLALADAERALPSVIDELEALFEELGIDDADIGIRMTGCPNGCARPYTADIAFVGRSPGVYDVYCGGRLAGDRLVDLLAEKVGQEEIVDVLRPILVSYRDERLHGEGFGDYWQRLVGHDQPRTILTGAKDLCQPTLRGEPMG
jgi:sulfite reductase (ferredoxin)